MTAKNAPPVSVWDALRRLLNCNRQQLADRLGVTARTLRRWEQGEAGADAHQRAAQLLRATLATAGADSHANPYLDWAKVEKIGGRR